MGKQKPGMNYAAFGRLASKLVEENELQGGLTGPGHPLVADAVTVDVHTPVGDVDASVSLQPPKGGNYLLAGLLFLGIAFFALRS